MHRLLKEKVQLSVTKKKIKNDKQRIKKRKVTPQERLAVSYEKQLEMNNKKWEELKEIRKEKNEAIRYLGDCIKSISK